MQTFGTATAMWRDSAHGHVEFSNLGWETNTSPALHVELNHSLGSQYSFVPDTNGSFALNVLELSFHGSDVSGLNGFFVFFDDIQVGAGQIDTGRTFSMPTTTSVTHTIQIRPGSNLHGDLGTRTASMRGSFDWGFDVAATTPVPEPGILWLLGAAFGLLGLRRSQKRRNRHG